MVSVNVYLYGSSPLPVRVRSGQSVFSHTIIVSLSLTEKGDTVYRSHIFRETAGQPIPRVNKNPDIHHIPRGLTVCYQLSRKICVYATRIMSFYIFVKKKKKNRNNFIKSSLVSVSPQDSRRTQIFHGLTKTICPLGNRL